MCCFSWWVFLVCEHVSMHVCIRECECILLKNIQSDDMRRSWHSHCGDAERARYVHHRHGHARSSRRGGKSSLEKRHLRYLESGACAHPHLYSCLFCLCVFPLLCYRHKADTVRAQKLDKDTWTEVAAAVKALGQDPFPATHAFANKAPFRRERNRRDQANRSNWRQQPVQQVVMQPAQAMQPMAMQPVQPMQAAQPMQPMMGVQYVQQPQYPGQQVRSARSCTHCGKAGHLVSDCWALHPDKNPNNPNNPNYRGRQA